MRRNILLLVAGVVVAVVLAFAIPVGIVLNSVIAQRVQHAAQDQAAAVALYLRNSTPGNTTLNQYLLTLSSSTERPTSVVLPGGGLVGAQVPQDHDQPPPGGPNGAPPDDHGGPPTLHGVSGGQFAETTAQNANGTYVVRVFVSDGALHAGVGEWWALLIGCSVALVLLAVGAGEVLTRRIVRPLTRTAATAHQLSAGDTAARAPADGPREVAEVGTALNRLADRIDELIAEERETVADMSHRMRTPLTALRLEAEGLRDPADAERLGNHISAMERTLTAVIHAARRPQREGRLPACDASAVVADRVRFWSALAEDQSRTSSVDLPGEPMPVRASADDLAAAVDALLENVIAHTAEGVGFTVRLWAGPVDGEGDGEDGVPAAATVHVEVADEGSGIPADALLRGRSDRGSSGLGLDIARRTAEAAGGAMTVTRGASGGAVVRLHLAPAGAPAATGNS